MLFRSKLAGKFTEQISISHNDAKNMMDDILEIDRVNKYKMEKCNIKDLILEISNELAFTFPDKIDLKTNFEHRNLAYINPAKIKRVLLNLISNAIEATGDRSIKISIDTKDLQNSAFIEISVMNTGSYIPQEIREMIFSSSYTKKSEHTTGLGLHICKEIIRKHGGQIRCFSHKIEGLEESQFTFTVRSSSSEP